MAKTIAVMEAEKAELIKQLSEMTDKYDVIAIERDKLIDDGDGLNQKYSHWLILMLSFPVVMMIFWKNTDRLLLILALRNH